MDETIYFQKFAGFSPSILTGKRRYKPHTMLLRQFDFPESCPKTSKVAKSLSTENPKAWEQAKQHLPPIPNYEESLRILSASDEQFLCFCQTVCEVNWQPKGARCVFITTETNLYPHFLIECYAPEFKSEAPIVYSHNQIAPNILTFDPQTEEIKRHLLEYEGPKLYN